MSSARCATTKTKQRYRAVVRGPCRAEQIADRRLCVRALRALAIASPLCRALSLLGHTSLTRPFTRAGYRRAGAAGMLDINSVDARRAPQIIFICCMWRRRSINKAQIGTVHRLLWIILRSATWSLLLCANPISIEVGLEAPDRVKQFHLPPFSNRGRWPAARGTAARGAVARGGDKRRWRRR